MSETREWRAIHGRAFTSTGGVHQATLSRHADETRGLAVWIDGLPYGPGDPINGDRIIGFQATDGESHEAIAMFNVQSRRGT